jgi:cyanophycin synthetase
MFDEIIIRHDHDMRGRTQENVTQLLTKGIQEVSKFIPIKVISEEMDALAYCIANAKKHSLIVDCTDAVQESTTYLTNKLEEERNENSAGSNKIIPLVVVNHTKFSIVSKQ